MCDIIPVYVSSGTMRSGRRAPVVLPFTDVCAICCQALQVVNSVRSEPCGNIRRVNVEIPSLSVSDMRRLKAADCVSVEG